MGTRGYRVYRHRGHYFVHEHGWDSYPCEYGLEVLSDIPEGSEFPNWLVRMRSMLDAQLKQWEEEGRPGPEPDQEDWISAKRPPHEPDWVYEIDLDWLVFHIQYRPFFRVDCRPPRESFLEYISYDHYGNMGYASHTPERHRYSWKQAPPPVEDRLIHAYEACMGENSSVSVPIHELLNARETLSNLESVWVRLLETVVGCIMFDRHAMQLKELEKRRRRDELTRADLAMGLTMVSAGLPSVTSFRRRPSFFEESVDKTGTWWAQENVYVFVTTHLDDKRNLQAAIADVHAAVMEATNSPDVVYGVVMSILRLAIIRVDKSVAGGAVQHTAALQFLPSFYATTPSTPGITALVRLGISTQTVPRPHFPPPHPLSGCPLLNLPTDILGEIAKYLTDFRDLRKFCALSDTAFSAAEPLLKYPLLENIILYSVSDTALPDSVDVSKKGLEEDEEDSTWHTISAEFDKHVSVPHLHLAAANFNTVVGDEPTVVTLRYFYSSSWGGDPRPQMVLGPRVFCDWPIDCRFSAYM
ncbi:hypothetical protein BOTBODRAFT_126110 [Botryobasidium botryosum FD-172 SS1]|uniref:F-box domain-containing protein n=1 Tax=Botryobasidium botryosum (strain FD-172 SS1) TaxID=930990 RepID=A0A067MUL9_BOTB1|nr:hypothetical protein BOTBODRAFT_126110 [Botryobasidium botryosum FD-172 SS1]